MKKGRIFIISAPSGSGKTTICKKVLKEVKNLKDSVSFTTRRPRPDEKHKKDYHYISRDKFKKEIKKGNLLEWEENFGYYYGTPKDFVIKNIEKGKSILLSIDVRGAMQVRKAFPKSVLIFVKPPSFKELKRRLEERKTDKAKDIEKRLKLAKKELKDASKYNYVVINEKLNKAIKETVAIIKKERKK